MYRESTKILWRVQKISASEAGSKVTSSPHFDTWRAAGQPCIEMRLLPGIIFVPSTKIRLMSGTEIFPGSKRIYYMDSLLIQDAGSISILRNSHPNQEGIKGLLTGNFFWPLCRSSTSNMWLSKAHSYASTRIRDYVCLNYTLPFLFLCHLFVQNSTKAFSLTIDIFYFKKIP